MLRTAIITMSVLFLLSGTIAAQEAAQQQQAQQQATQQDPGLAAMQASPVAELVGTWEGTGWVRRGPGEPYKTRGQEVVESRLEGRVLVIEGKHWSGEADASDAVVHHAMAVLSYDNDAGHYRFRSHMADGRGGDFTAEVEGEDLIWYIPLPNSPDGKARIRYVIRIEDDQWHEIGEMTRDGESWNQFFEMTLRRVAN